MAAFPASRPKEGLAIKTVSDLILEQLAAYGVRFIFGVVGDAIFPLAEALARQQTIRFVPAAIETTAAMMAAFAAQLSGAPGVCIGTSGPGAANLVNGTGSALLDRVPLLCLTGQVAGSQLGTETKQYINQRQLFTAVTAASEMCIHPGSVVPVLSRLLNQALSGPGAVHLEIPVDILAHETDAMPIQPPPLQPSLNGTGAVQGGLDDILKRLEQAQRPLLVLGRGARDEGEAWAGFAAHYGTGIIISQENKGMLPDRHPLVLGGIGEAYLPDCLGRCDQLLCVGEAVYEENYFPAATPVVRFTPSLSPSFQPYPVVRGDLAVILRKLREHFPHRLPREEWRKELDRCRQARLQLVESLPGPRHPAAVMRALAAVAPPDALIALDVGEFAYWFDLGFLAERQRVLLSSSWRSMGVALPAGIAACLLRPDRKTVALVGDGGLLMSLAELATVARYRLPLTILVLRNGCYGLEIQKMRQQKMTPYGTDLVLPDLVRLGEAFGIPAYRIGESSPAEAVLRQALAAGPALVDLAVDSVPLPYLK